MSPTTTTPPTSSSPNLDLLVNELVEKLLASERKEKRFFTSSFTPPSSVEQAHPFKFLSFEGMSLREIRHECSIPPSSKEVFWLTINHREFPRIDCLPEGVPPKQGIKGTKGFIIIPYELAINEQAALAFFRTHYLSRSH